MAMTTKINFLGCAACLRGIGVSEESAVFSWVLTFQFDVGIKMCLHQMPKSIICAVAISPIPTHTK